MSRCFRRVAAVQILVWLASFFFVTPSLAQVPADRPSTQVYALVSDPESLPQVPADSSSTQVYVLISDSDENSLPLPPLKYKVYLPAGYDPNREQGYPVLYLLHGSHGNEASWDDFWPVLDEMIEKGTIEPVIAVAPVTGNSYWVDSKKFGAYETAVIHHLIPTIDAYYNTIPSREGRFLVGYSMGGFGALRYALVYPHLFGGATLLSPAIWDGLPPSTSRAVTGGAFGEPFDPRIWNEKNYPAALENYVKQEYQVPIFIYTGDDDWNHVSEKEDLPPDAYQYNVEVQAVRLYVALHRKNLYQVDFPKWEEVPTSPAELRIVNGGHDTDVWIPGFREGLVYMFASRSVQ